VRALVVGNGGSLADGLAAGLVARGWSAAVASPEGPLPLEPPLDLLVHSWVHPEALREQAVADTSEASFVAGAEGSMRTAVAVAQAAFPALRASGRGRLIYVVPTIASAGAAGFAAYCAVAEGLRGMAKSLAKQWGKYGITVNSLLVAPQLVVTGDVGQRLADGVSIAVPALGAADPAADLAPVVALLASEDGHYATGSTLVLDGGVWTVH
jgi:NAD(P)-dependent dehydrogenase (short-subunit alcohol dehydrogenase family)